MPPVSRDGLQCPRCDRVTYHPVDVLSGWCSACSAFTSTTADQVLAAASTIEAAVSSPAVADTIRWRLRRFGALDVAGDVDAV